VTADPYDAVQDARSETRYEDDPSAEPTQDEIDAARQEPWFACLVDESAGFRG